jgi:hypothetical protein
MFEYVREHAPLFIAKPSGAVSVRLRRDIGRLRTEFRTNASADDERVLMSVGMTMGEFAMWYIAVILNRAERRPGKKKASQTASKSKYVLPKEGCA